MPVTVWSDSLWHGGSVLKAEPRNILTLVNEMGHLDAAEATLALETDSANGLFDVTDTTLALRRRHLLARIHLLKGRTADAERQAREVLQLRPAFGPALLTLAQCALERRNLEEVDRLEASIPDGPESATGRAILEARRALHRGDHERARSVARHALTADPGSTFLERMLVVASLEAADPEASDRLGAMLRAEPLDLELCALARTVATGEDDPR